MENDWERITFLISSEEKGKLVKLAKSKDLTLSQVIRRAIKKILEDNTGDKV